MAIQVSYPGVYIEELPATGPIEGVGTSTAAFLGPARNGDPNRPTLITSFDEFRQRFDNRPINGFYLWYAVRGFFENGGRRAHIVRVSNGEYARLELLDSRTTGAQPTLVIRARELGVGNIPVEAQAASYVTTTAFRPQATFTNVANNTTTIQVEVDPGPPMTAAAQVAAQFRAGDKIRVGDANNNETATVRRVSGATLITNNPLTHDYSNGAVRIANLENGTRVFRVMSTPDGRTLGPGSVITIQQGATSETATVAAVQTERIRPDLTTYRLELEADLANGPYDLNPGVPDEIEVTSHEFTLNVSNGAEVRENLSMARNNARYFGAVLAVDPFNIVVVTEPDVPSNAPLHLLSPATGPFLTDAGTPETLEDLSPAEYQTALDALRQVDDVNFIAIPDSIRLPSDTDIAVAQLALLTHCAEMADRFAIFDPPPNADRETIGDVIDQLRSERGFGALYFPWIRAPHPETGLLLVPPSGHVAGIYARADTERGVHKAPANYILTGALGVAHDMNNEQQGVLNLDGINVLRVFPDSARPVVWGARTTSNDTAWQYINVRRLFLFIEESIEEGIRWAVFEPNNLQLWQKLRRTITDFLTRVWRDGALFGATAEEAFYVRVDEVLNPFSEQALGRLNIEIGIRPTYPAEFIRVRIGIWRGGSEVSEG